MNGFLKFALGVAVLGVVGLVGLSVMSIVATLVFSRSASHRVVPGEEVPARAVAVSDVDRGVYDTFNTPAMVPHSVPANWSQPAQVQVTVHESWIDAASPFVGIILLFGMPALIFIVIRSMRRGRATAPSDESALVHELARRAQDLSQRMEALETILLDRTRSPFHNEKVKQS